MDDDSDDDLPRGMGQSSSVEGVLSRHPSSTSSQTENLATEQQYVEDNCSEERDISSPELGSSDNLPRRKLERGARVTSRPKCAYFRSDTRHSFSSEISCEGADEHVCETEPTRSSSFARNPSGLHRIPATESDSSKFEINRKVVVC